METTGSFEQLVREIGGSGGEGVESDRRLTSDKACALLAASSCADVDFLLSILLRSGGRAHGISAGQFDGSSAHREALLISICTKFHGKMYTIVIPRRDPALRSIFGRYYEVAAHVSAGERGDRTIMTHPLI